MINNELTRADIDIEPENIEVYFEDPHVINFCIQTWFDVDKKLGINILDEDEMHHYMILILIAFEIFFQIFALNQFALFY